MQDTSPIYSVVSINHETTPALQTLLLAYPPDCSKRARIHAKEHPKPQTQEGSQHCVTISEKQSPAQRRLSCELCVGQLQSTLWDPWSPANDETCVFFVLTIPCTEVHHGFARRWLSQGTVAKTYCCCLHYIHEYHCATTLHIQCHQIFPQNIFLGIRQPILPGANTSFFSILDSDRSIWFNGNLSKWIVSADLITWRSSSALGSNTVC